MRAGEKHADTPPKGLRERKKEKNRALIQSHALRLFSAQGYAATTVEQIAAAAAVSPSTFFRYFGSKEDVVRFDNIAPHIIEALEAQPRQLSPLDAIRAAFRDANERLPEMLWETEEQRERIIRATPELHAAIVTDAMSMIQKVSEIIAERVGRAADDFKVRTFCGALMGVTFLPRLAMSATSIHERLDMIDKALAFLEEGMPL